MTLNGDAIFKEKLTVRLTNEIRRLVNFHASSCKSENLMGWFFPKHINFQMRQYKRVMFHYTED